MLSKKIGELSKSPTRLGQGPPQLHDDRIVGWVKFATHA
jgi:hypothetical protein